MPLTIDADFPGGNIIVEDIIGYEAFVRQDLRDTTEDWMYWHFRAEGVAGKLLTCHFVAGRALGTRGPAVSLDRGHTWNWAGQEVVDGNSFSYQCPPDIDVIHFCFAIPYHANNFEIFLAQYVGHPCLQVSELCRSRKGRPVELVQIRDRTPIPKSRILLTARHHSCECLANYVLEGIFAEALGDAENDCWQQVELVAIPFMDKDGVEDGDQGKLRAPHDHCRDYGANSLYPETTALQQRTDLWSDGLLSIVLDIHCPWISGKWNEHIYFVGMSDLDIWARVNDFSRLVEQENNSPLPFHTEDNLPFGVDWNTEENYSNGKTLCHWASDLPNIKWTSSIEFPYANVNEVTVTAENARHFGHVIARALNRYLSRR